MRLGARIRAVDRALCPKPCRRCDGYCVDSSLSLRTFGRAVEAKKVNAGVPFCNCHPGCEPYAALLRDATDLAWQMAGEGKADPEIEQALMGFLTGAA